MAKILTGKVGVDWEATQKNAQAVISQALGVVVTVGDDAFVYIISNAGGPREKWTEIGALVFVNQDPEDENSGDWIFRPSSEIRK